MKVNKLIFKNIRNFNSEVTFDFSQTGKVNTISGRNGSGKTTIFKCLLLAQKTFFVEQMEDRLEFQPEIGNELAKYFTSKDSSIDIQFSFEDKDEEFASFKIICHAYFKESIFWDIKYGKIQDREKIKKYWDIENPRDLIFYVDSNKYFDEQDISHDNIAISTTDNQAKLALDTILNPEKIFSNIYQRLIKDYIGERLVPAKPRRELYFIPTRILLKELLPQIKLKNFSAQHFQGQFVLLGTVGNDKTVSSYDIRNFSSGEKSLFYILLFINYVQKIGMLIIDEPENHFHEDLLVKFIKSLSEICNSKNYADYIISKDPKLKEKGKSSEAKEIQKQYNQYYLSQVFLLTHSKNLMYNNFSNETNFYVEHGFKKIEFENFEKTLREIGISSVFSKVLFVEGSTENEYLNMFLNEYNIKIHALKGCGQVIDTYKKIANIKSYLRETHFCFLIDKDTRSAKEIDEIRKPDPQFFDNHFVVLDRHEFENYLLDPIIFSEIYKQLPFAVPITNEEIDKIIFKNANKQKIHLFKKALKTLNERSITLLKEKLVKKDIQVETLKDYQNYLESQIDSAKMEVFIRDKFIGNYNICDEMYNGDIWAKSWRELCDGKSVLQITISDFSHHLGVREDKLRVMIKSIVSNNRSLAITKVIDSLISKFD